MDSPVIKSDSLASLRSLFEAYPQLAIFNQIFQLTVIVDANVIIADLIWLTKTRRKPGARTELQEVIAAETLIAIAPQWLEEEILENIPRISNKENIPEPKLYTIWQEYRKLIRFESNEEYSYPLPDEVQDPDDLAYLVLQQKTGHPIYSKDSDLKNMGASLLPANVIMTLKDYSRSEAVELTFIMGYFGAFTMGIEIFKLAWNAIKSLFSAFATLPNWAKYLVAALLLITIIHPKTRDWFIQFIRDSSKQLSPAFKKLVEATGPMFEKYKNAEEKSDQSLSDLKKMMPNV